MKIRKAFKYKLKPNSAQNNLLYRFAGCSRFVWNRGLAIIKESLEQKQGYQNYNVLAKKLTQWKKEEETLFLKEVHSQPLQQTLKDLDRACKDAFKKIKGFPKFKKKGFGDSFRYPQRVKTAGDKVFLPKIGWLKFQKSREMEGTIKNTSVSLRAGKWYISFQVEFEIAVKERKTDHPVGVDLGVANFAYLSSGAVIKPLNSFKKLQHKLAKAQKKLSRKKKFSSNWKKQKTRISKTHAKIADCRKDFLQKQSTVISKNHALIALENLKVSNMSGSARGDLENPGENVKAKSGLNRSILDQGWFEFRRMLEYKQLWSGGKLVLVNPKNTSRKCSRCGCINKNNRKTQAVFVCRSCGHKDHADFNAAKNILEAGLTSIACGDIKTVAS